jgi:hypothetical protein
MISHKLQKHRVVHQFSFQEPIVSHQVLVPHYQELMFNLQVLVVVNLLMIHTQLLKLIHPVVLYKPIHTQLHLLIHLEVLVKPIHSPLLKLIQLEELHSNNSPVKNPTRMTGLTIKELK